MNSATKHLLKKVMRNLVEGEGRRGERGGTFAFAAVGGIAEFREPESDKREDGDLARERFRRGHRVLPARVDVDTAARRARDERAHRVHHGDDGQPFVQGERERAVNVFRLATLRDHENRCVRCREVRIAQLRRINY